MLAVLKDVWQLVSLDKLVLPDGLITGFGGDEVVEAGDGTRSGVEVGDGSGFDTADDVEEAEAESLVSFEKSQDVLSPKKETKNRPIAGRKTKTAVRNAALKTRTKPIRVLLIHFRLA